MTGALESFPCTEQELGCYSRLYSARACVVTPPDVAGVADAFALARREKRNVTLRAGAHCFDSQALGNDIVISMLAMNRVEVLASERKVRVEPGARWGDIIGKLKKDGLVPAVTVTTEDATAGGTLSGDCLSRFSPAYGKEGEQIESFELLTTEGGDPITCTPPAEGSDPSSWTQGEQAFCGVISGLGHFGAVTSITYKVKKAVEPGEPIGVKTLAYKTDTFADLADQLMPRVQEMIEQDSDPQDTTKLDAIWSALDTRSDGSRSAILFTSAFQKGTDGKRMLLHRPKLLVRLLAEWGMRRPAISSLLWRIYISGLFRHKQTVYVDELEGFTFFMDGNARAKRIGERFGFKMQNAQQTFVVPSDPRTDGGWDQSKDDLVEWLEFAHGFLLERRLAPTLHDVLYLPKDRPFMLSASADMPGFACSYAFETSSAKRLERVQQAFIELSDILWERFGGRVYLVKNVFARPQTLQEMYGAHLDEFIALKDELDPSGTLQNEFFSRKLGLNAS